jgi:hypothetical protein
VGSDVDGAHAVTLFRPRASTRTSVRACNEIPRRLLVRAGFFLGRAPSTPRTS